MNKKKIINKLVDYLATATQERDELTAHYELELTNYQGLVKQMQARIEGLTKSLKEEEVRKFQEQTTREQTIQVKMAATPDPVFIRNFGERIEVLARYRDFDFRLYSSPTGWTFGYESPRYRFRTVASGDNVLKDNTHAWSLTRTLAEINLHSIGM